MPRLRHKTFFLQKDREICETGDPRLQINSMRTSSSQNLKYVWQIAKEVFPKTNRFPKFLNIQAMF